MDKGRKTISTDDGTNFGKLCEHPLVRGFHRLITLVGVPVVVSLLIWVATAFDNLRTTMVRVETTLSIEIPALKRNDEIMEQRVQRVEARISSVHDQGERN